MTPYLRGFVAGDYRYRHRVLRECLQKHPDGFLFGVLLSVTAMLAWSVGPIFIVRNKVNMNPYYATRLADAYRVVHSFYRFTFQPAVPLAAITQSPWLAITYLVLAGSPAGICRLYLFDEKLPAAVSSPLCVHQSLVAMVAAYFVVNEKLTMNILWGAIVTLVGVFLVNYSIKRNREKIIANPSYKPLVEFPHPTKAAVLRKLLLVPDHSECSGIFPCIQLYRIILIQSRFVPCSAFVRNRIGIHENRTGGCGVQFCFFLFKIIPIERRSHQALKPLMLP